MLGGCQKTLNPSLMFKTPKEYPYTTGDTLSLLKKQFVFATQDRFEMRVYTNDGFKLVDISQGTETTSENIIEYEINKDSLVKLPLLGKINIVGLTIDSAEKILEKLFSQYYIDPFIFLEITNRNIYVFLGDGGNGKVVRLQNNNVSLIEALALAGGVEATGKAYKIKIIRGDLKNPEVYLVDLSTVDGLKKSNLYVQSNDIIYIEPIANTAQKLLNQIAPVMGIIASVVLIVELLK